MALARLVLVLFVCSWAHGIDDKKTADIALNKLQRDDSSSGTNEVVGGSKAFVKGLEVKANNESAAVIQLQKEEEQGSADERQERAEPSLCPLSKDMDRPQPVAGLQRCPEYRESSCCSKEEDDLLDADFISAYEYVYNGCSGCLENFRKLQCAMKCSPDQRDFVTTEQQSGRVVVRMCPEFCHRFFSSCINTTARKVFHADDGTFCAAQLDTSGGTDLVIDQYSCINEDGPSYCNGRYVHEVDSDDAWTTKQIVKVSIVASLTAAIVLCCLYKMCRGDKEDLYLREPPERHPYYRPTLFIPGAPDSHSLKPPTD